MLSMSILIQPLREAHTVWWDQQLRSHLANVCVRVYIPHPQSPKKIRILGSRIRGRFGKSEEGLPKHSRVMSWFETNGASLKKSINYNSNWLSEKRRRILYLPYHEKPYYSLWGRYLQSILLLSSLNRLFLLNLNLLYTVPHQKRVDDAYVRMEYS